MSRIDEAPLGAAAQIPHRVDSVPAARVFLVRLLEGWEVEPSAIDDAALLTTELMGNAVEHGGAGLTLAISLDGPRLHIAVHDGGFDLPEVLPWSGTSEDGR